MAAPPPFPAQDQITDSATTEERKSKEKGIKFPCPRCNSSNTKFCYYNNYSLRQPRYLCKACKRYWTQGGSLRSIPVGGTTRKNSKFRSSSCSSSSSGKIKLPHLVESSNDVTVPTNPNPKLTPNYLLQFPTVELLTGMPMPEASYWNSAYPVGLSLDGIASVWGGRRVLFPFEDLSSTATAAATSAVTATADSINSANVNHQEHRRDHDQLGDSTGYWTGNMHGVFN